MRPFRNQGWGYLTKFQEMLPVSGAKGKRAFVATAAASSSKALVDELDSGEEEESSAAVGSGRTAGDGKIGDVGDGGDGGRKISASSGNIGGSESMEVDEVEIVTSITSVSSSSKRKHSHIDDTLTFQSGGTSTATSVPGTSMASSEPVNKKPSSALAKSKSARSSSVANKPSPKVSGKISNAAILNGMQGSINRITDVFERSVNRPLDPEAEGRSEALHLLQNRDDGLDLDERTKLLQIFHADPRAYY